MRIKSKRGPNEKGLMQKLEAWPPKLKYDILVKCWTLPNGKATFGRCCEDHPELLKSVINCSAFKTILQDLRSKLEEQWQHKNLVLVMCVDQHGRHRSRALAAIMKAFFKIKGFTSHGPFHCSTVGWKQKQCVLERCRKRQEDTQKIYAALADEW